MFDVAILVSDAMRDIDRRDGKHLEDSHIRFNASFIIGGQIKGEPLRLFRIYARRQLHRGKPGDALFPDG